MAVGQASFLHPLDHILISVNDKKEELEEVKLVIQVLEKKILDPTTVDCGWEWPIEVCTNVAEVVGALAPNRELPSEVNDFSCHLALSEYLTVVLNGCYCQTVRMWTTSMEALAVPFSKRWSRYFHPCSRILALDTKIIQGTLLSMDILTLSLFER